MSQQYTNWANHNVFTFTGRVMDAHLMNGQYGETLSVTMITTMVTDGAAMSVQFTNKNGLMTMFKNGNLVKGMQEIQQEKQAAMQQQQQLELIAG